MIVNFLHFEMLYQDISEKLLEIAINVKEKLKMRKNKNWLKRGERSDTYLTDFCRLHSVESLERTDEKPEL